MLLALLLGIATNGWAQINAIGIASVNEKQQKNNTVYHSRE